MVSFPMIFYTSNVCPASHRVELAFAEAGIEVTRYYIDLQNKPEWFAAKVNPVGKVPALVYDTDTAHPEEPSPHSAKLAESMVLIEFVADLMPNTSLMPSDPVSRARVRFFMDAVSQKIIPGYISFILKGEAPETLYSALSDIQDLLSSEEEGSFAVPGGKWTIADACVVPYLSRFDLYLQNEYGLYEEGMGKKVHKEIFEGERFRKLSKYYKEMTARESWKKTYKPDEILKLSSQIARGSSWTWANHH